MTPEGPCWAARARSDPEVALLPRLGLSSWHRGPPGRGLWCDAGGFGATRKCSRTSKGTSGGQREAGIICGQFPAPTRPVRGRALRVPGSETGPGGVTSLPQASPAHPRPGQGAGSLNAFTAPRKLRWGRLGPRRGPPAPCIPCTWCPGRGCGGRRAWHGPRRTEAAPRRGGGRANELILSPSGL